MNWRDSSAQEQAKADKALLSSPSMRWLRLLEYLSRKVQQPPSRSL